VILTPSDFTTDSSSSWPIHFAEHIRRRPQLRNTALNLHDVLHGLTLAELWEHQQLSLDTLPVSDSAPPS